MAWTIRLGGLPAAGFGDRDVLPVLRSDAADRLVGRGQKVTWPLAFLQLVAESAQAGLRTLDRLEGAAWQGQGTRETSNGGQGCRTRSTAATRAGADAEGRGGKAPGRDADWDGIAQELEAPGGILPLQREPAATWPIPPPSGQRHIARWCPSSCRRRGPRA
jgi:hypothetical protein